MQHRQIHPEFSILNFRVFTFLFLFLLLTFSLDAQKIIFGSYYKSPQDFEAFVRQAKEAGATHINLKGSVSISEYLPRSLWQYDTPGDPYPGWTVAQLSILKIAAPPKLLEFIPADYSEKVMGILESQCRVLKKYGLKAAISFTDPAMLPEAVYEKYPSWRGPIVSHPSRSNVTRFAPSTDDPEVRELYREAMSILLKRCPEIDILTFLTNDSGAGLDWSTGLYNGQIGNTRFSGIPMDRRVRTFFESLLAGAKDAGRTVDINMTNTREREPGKIASTLSRGMAIDGLEGPDATRFIRSAGVDEGYFNPFFPVYGIPLIIRFAGEVTELAQSNAPRLSISVTDEVNRTLYFRIYAEIMKNPPANDMEKLALLNRISEEIAGKDKAGDFLKLHQALDETTAYFPLLMSGGYIFNLGCVQQRWLIRPFVPFPEELPADIANTWQTFQFQADRERINNLADVQASDIYYGWSGRYFSGRIIDNISRNVAEAQRLAGKTGDDDLRVRLEVFRCILNNASNAVSYQAQLDRIRELGLKPLKHDVTGTQSGWDRQLLMGTARNENDNTVLLIKLLGDDPGKYIRIAPVAEQEDISLLGPDIINQLKLKLKLMNARWEDYKRIFPTPNL